MWQKLASYTLILCQLLISELLYSHVADLILHMTGPLKFLSLHLCIKVHFLSFDMVP